MAEGLYLNGPGVSKKVWNLSVRVPIAPIVELSRTTIPASEPTLEPGHHYRFGVSLRSARTLYFHQFFAFTST